MHISDLQWRPVSFRIHRGCRRGVHGIPDLLVAVGVEEPVLGLTRLLIEDRLFSCLHDAVLAEAEVRDLIVRHIHDLSSGLHDAEITEGVFFCVDREERIPLFRGNVWFSCFKAEGVHLVGFVDPGNPSME